MAVMRETLAVAKALGWDLTKEIDVEKTASRAQPGPGPKPSMLQDVLLGRPVEVESHIGQTQAFAREAGWRCRRSMCWCRCCGGWIDH